MERTLCLTVLAKELKNKAVTSGLQNSDKGFSMEQKRVKGIGLLSGGLDSILAVKVLQEQDLDLLGVTFCTPFFGAEPGLAAGRAAGIEVQAIDISEAHLKMLKNPRYGYGKQMNPCIDCHALMLQEAGKIMRQEGADFVFTGEVLGQRPMSQRRDALRNVEKLSGLTGLILRPLSAKLLPPTLVELDGRVARDKLLDIHGRGRKRQMALAADYAIRDYPNPSGGCVLTKEGFVIKLRELLQHDPDAGRRDMELLKWGRHFRLPGGSKCMVGRNHSDNQQLLALAGDKDILLRAKSYVGPVAMITGPQVAGPDPDLAAGIVAAYGDAPVGEVVTVVRLQYGEEKIFVIRKEENSVFRQFMIE
jgi:tRNA-uridine 2-sulfurtransferase